MSLVEAVVAFCCRHARTVVVLCLIAVAAGAAYTATHFAINNDTDTLISPDLPWRKAEARFDKLFPQRNNLVLVVVDGATAELAQSAADQLADKLAADPKAFPAVRRPDGGSFFAQNGLLYLSEDEVRKTTQNLIQAEPFLGGLAADPSLHGVMASFGTVLLGIQHHQAKLGDIDAPMIALNGTLRKIEQGKTAFLSWRTLFAGNTGGERTRSFIEVQPTLDYDAITPGLKATDLIRKTARDLGLVPANGVRVRLTGPVPLSDDDFATLAHNADLMGLVTLLCVTLMLWLAVHSFRIIVCILATLFSGLIITTALGLLAAHVFNILSIAFIALFVGLGVDFAIQFSVRYRSERHRDDNLKRALAGAGRKAGIPLALAAAATAAGFFSFLPTNYVGVAELGLVAGMGMIVAFILAITFLPALLLLVKPPGEAERVGFRLFAPADRFFAKHRGTVLRLGALAGVLALCTLPFLKFDFNPLDLRDRHAESVSTLYDLMQDPQTSPYTIDVLAPSLAAADRLADKLREQKLIGLVLTLDSFVPDDQQKKLAMISDASFLLDAALNPIAVKPQPSDAETVEAITAVANGLDQAAGKSKSDPAAHARDLAATLKTLAAGPPALRQKASAALVPGLQKLLDELRQALQAGPVSLSTMPKEMVQEWIAADGTARIQVFPKDNPNDNKSLKRFSKAVLAVTDEATGAPITIQESGETIVGAFVQAGIWSFLVITFLLLIVLRRVGDVARTIAPLILTALLTLATCRIAGLQLNYANIIALPLLLGIGVAFNIYFVVAWRAGSQPLLQSSLTRAVIFSALTTASGFGPLWLSQHPGTASMGELLIISLGWTLFTTLFYLPALLGPPPGRGETAK